MNHYRCTVYDSLGKKLIIQRSAETAEALQWELQKEQLLVIEISEGSTEPRAANRRLDRKSILLFTEHLKILLESGIDLKNALAMCQQNIHKAALKQFLSDVNSAVEKGQSLSQAMEPYQQSLGHLYLGMIRVGERTGNLSPVIDRLVAYLQQMSQVREKIIGALAYPLLVIGVASIGITLLLIFVIPVLMDIASTVSKGAGQKYGSQISLFQGNVIIFALVLFIIIIVFIIIKVLASRNVQVRTQLHSIFWNMPILRMASRTGNMLFLAFAMETLLVAGYTVDEAMKEANKTVGNLYFRSVLETIRLQLTQGQRFESILGARKDLPEEFRMWVGVGERAGTLNTVFGQLRNFYQHDLNKKSQLLMSLVEPALIIMVGIVLLSLIQSIITPLFAMMGNLL